MAVKAVASVVIQKLTDMLAEESIMHQSVIVEQLNKIKEALESMEGFFIDAEDKQKKDPEVKRWADEYLRHIYDVEDTIETFALRFARQRKRLGFLMNHALFLKNFTACRCLSSKIKRIRSQINELNRKKPGGVEDLSVNSTLRSPSAPTTTSNDEITNSITLNQKEEADLAEDDEVLELPNGAIARSRQVLYHPHQHHLNSNANGTLRHSASANSGVSTAFTDDHPASERKLISHPARNGWRQLSDVTVYADRLAQARQYSYSYDEEELDIVGFKEEVADLVNKLTEANNTSTGVVSIVGLRGSGKTTLARAVYGNRRIKEYFQHCPAWVTVHKESNQIDLLHKLLKQVSDSKVDQGGLSGTDEQALKSRLSERLKDKRYLIVLDDFESLEMWDNLKNAFPNQGNGSKILLISSSQQVDTTTNIQLHRLKNLSSQDSWDLFLKKAGLEEGPENIKQRLLDVCNCLPLNIVLLGSLLSTKKEDEWPGILSSANWEAEDIMSLSYNDLPANLKLCLLYTVLFPKEYDIPVRRLQRLWLAEGFVKRPTAQPSLFPEDEVKKYFDDLVRRSLIQVSKLTSDGNPKRCRLPGVLHDYLMPKAEVISLFHAHHKSDTCEVVGARRLVQYTDIRKWDAAQLGSLRSYVSFNIQYRDTPAKEVGDLLSSIISCRLRLLRVLDLEGVYKPSLPENLGDFFHLRYLGLRWTFLDALPQSVGQLHYLEALDIKHTYINSLPTFIWKLKHLRHLYANGIRLDLPSRHFASSLPQLLTLWGFSVDDDSQVKDGLNSLRDLRELGIIFNLTNSEELLHWISELTAIQTLNLRSKDDAGRPSKLILKPLSNLRQLTHLKLLGNLPKLPEKRDFPHELKVLTLSVSNLEGDPMPILGELKYLTVLRLLADSYLGDTMVCPEGGFKELRVLKLWMLKKLEQWDVKEGAMERLKELNIRCCNKLTKIPCKLLQQKTLKEITLTNMSAEFRSQVERTKDPHIAIISKRYDFSPLPWQEADDS